MTKVCSICFKTIELNSNNFHKNKRSKDGFVDRCKECVQKYQQEYYHRIPMRKIEPYREKIIQLLKTTKLSCEKIGKQFGFSYLL